MTMRMIKPGILFCSAKSTGFNWRCQTRFARVRRAVVFACMLLTALGLQAQEQDAGMLARGERALAENRPEDAVGLLRAARQEEPNNQRVYLYLGVALEQLGRHEEAISVLQDGIEAPGNRNHLLLFNIGNNYARLGMQEEAEEAYSRAIDAQRSYADPYLNRANTRVNTGDYQEAVDDYRVFLNLRPSDPQRPEIEQMIALLRDEVEAERERQAEAERQRQIEEARRREEEERRRAEEQRRAEEEARRQAEAEARRQELLDSVLNSLSETTEDTEGLSAGQEELEDVEEDLDIAE